jgi:V8-like Glu-specific endopeptidase
VSNTGNVAEAHGRKIIMSAQRTPAWGFAVLSAVVLAAIGATPLMGSRHFQLIGRQTEAAIKTADVIPRRVVDARLAPYAAVGRFEGTMTCTAAIVVHPRIIVTAAHCITGRDGSIRKSNLSFRLGYQSGTDRGRFEATVWAVGSKQSFRRQSVRDASQDWVILILDRTPKSVEPLVLGDHSFDTLRTRERQFFMPSYSSDIGDADVLSADPACSIRDIAWDVLVHDCRGRSGSSGAPLLKRDRVQYAVVGIHTGAMFASDGGGHVAEFVGNRAIGSRMFAQSLLALLRQLNSEAADHVDSPAY